MIHAGKGGRSDEGWPNRGRPPPPLSDFAITTITSPIANASDDLGVSGDGTTTPPQTPQEAAGASCAS